MKKALKISAISLGSLLGLIVIVVGVALWIVFTPSRLTSMVNNLSNKYITCESHFNHVDLTLFSTFPDLGLEVCDVVLVNSMEGAPSDTLLAVDRLVVGFDVKAYLKGGNIIVRKLILDGIHANMYIDADGHSNFDLFPPSDDTTSSPFEMPDSILLHSVRISNLNASFVDCSHAMKAVVEGVDLSLDGEINSGTLVSDLQLTIDSLFYNSGKKNEMALSAKSLVMNLDGTLLQSNGKADLTVSADQIYYRSASGETVQLLTDLRETQIHCDATGNMGHISGCFDALVSKALLQAGTVTYCTPQTVDDKSLLAIRIPFSYDMLHSSLQIDTATVDIAERHSITATGNATLATDEHPLAVDMQLSTNTWKIRPLLALLPPEYTTWNKQMSLDGRLRLQASCKGTISDSTTPAVAATVYLSDGSWSDTTLLPSAVKDIEGSIKATMKPTGNKDKPYTVSANLKQLKAQWQESTIAVDAIATDLTGRMPFNATIAANVNSDDLSSFLPDTLPMNFSGRAALTMTVKSDKSQLMRQDWQHVQAQLQLSLRDVDVTSDSFQVATPNITLSAQLYDAGVAPGIAFDLKTATTKGTFGTMGANTTSIALKGRACYDADQPDLLHMLQPEVTFNLNEATVFTPAIQQVLRINSLHADYRDGRCDSLDASIVCGLSDYRLSGHVDGVSDYLSHGDMLHAVLNFYSSYTDVDQLLNMFSGMGTDKDTLEVQRAEAAPTANPFIVPKNIDVRLKTHIKSCVAFDNRLNDVSGGLTVNDGVMVLDQMGFVCKAARMQLTGVYKSPRFNHLFLGLDFHLLDIQIDELIDMIPTIDTLVPMLKSFNGNADFHLAAETYLTAEYKPKMSTMLGAAALSGKDLVVLDNETFDKISSLLMFKKKTVNKIDSLDVEMTVFRNELDVYPFLLSMDRYQVCVSGRHSLDNKCNYHLELLHSPLPIRLAVDVKGTLTKPSISLSKVRYANLFKPEKQNKLQERTMSIKRQVREALERNVK